MTNTTNTAAQVAPVVAASELSDEQIAATAYSQFGIVADDQEIAAFARWVLAAATPAASELSDCDLLRRAATEAADYLEAVARKTSRDGVWDRCTSIAGDLRLALAGAAPAAQQPAEGGWISVDERMPEDGQTVLVFTPGMPVLDIWIDTWREQHEAPVSFSSATVPIGLGWDDHEFEAITHWQPLPAPPQEIA